MLTIAVFPNVTKDNAAEILYRIVAFYKDKDVRLIMPLDESRFFDMESYGVPDIEKIPADLALCLGGDGTLLGVCHRYGDAAIPLCGVNIGTLGFMADIEPDELETKLQKIIDKDYHIEHRLLLAGFVHSCGKQRFIGHAINDVVVTKGGVARMLHLGLSINSSHLIDYKADGLIVSTPTGSTAYSLSAGGPIMNPNIRALLLTPICAHTFNMRPLAIREDDVVHIEIAAVHQDIIVTLDGQESYRLLPGDEVIVQKSKVQANIVKFDDKDYYQILRTKLWRND
ncbi:NAD(+)/NADH kinase [Mitsuokella sp.]|uniref:NAD(+)/NADH kinase n=1 Tax=Mitsuokella TaxID=52225 RepID=UPI0029E15B6C|nr:NAD(+)/NADH kinase [Mitsuokella sp.]MDD6383314.1 NAD(+)/NADH kinase [Selenomonadaceae bacterium]MDY4475603.1 NAD(+)/NADH kinase [Mitsuokella sp.]